jgi:hypothetical protein
MTYRDSDALCLPARPPQHAAPVSFLRRRGSPRQLGESGWLRRLTRQVLQLFLTFVAWATGLGLVIGSIVLVATVTAPTGAGPLKAVSRGDTSLQRTVQNPVQYPAGANSGAAARHPGNQVLAAFSGHGNRTTRQFIVRGRQPWQLRWTYRCGQHVRGGRFILQLANMAAGQATIRTSVDMNATSGHGSASLKASGHRHYLNVLSACSWSVTVVQARPLR